MQRQMLRTAVLRLSAFAVLLVSFACCAGPTETVDEASEALTSIAPIARSVQPIPALRLPRPTAEELARAAAEVEQFVRDHLPKWKVYLSGRDSYVSTGRADSGTKYFYRHPIDLDHACALVLVPEGGDTRPETWLYLSYQRYWMRGASYLTDELKLSVFDILGILLALEDAGGALPALPSLDEAKSGDVFRYEDGGPYGFLPPTPPDWIIDDHTWTGGPPAIGVRHPLPSTPPPSGARPPAPSAQPPPGGARPRLPKDWPKTPIPTPPPSLEDRLNGVGPADKPVGKYPGWDQPHPNERWSRFRCGGQVWEGYRSDCPDFQRRPLGERWKTPFEDLARDLAKNARQTNELIRTDPNCTFVCKLIAATPALLHMVCIEAKVTPAMMLVCTVFRSLTATVAASIAGLKFDDACEKWCQQPPSVLPGGRP